MTGQIVMEMDYDNRMPPLVFIVSSADQWIYAI